MCSLPFNSSTTLFIPCLVRALGTTRCVIEETDKKTHKLPHRSTHPHLHDFLMCSLQVFTCDKEGENVCHDMKTELRGWLHYLEGDDKIIQHLEYFVDGSRVVLSKYFKKLGDVLVILNLVHLHSLQVIIYSVSDSLRTVKG